LVQLLDRCSRHSDGRPHRLIFVGDYIDRAIRSRQESAEHQPLDAD
jgi:hypothetical protein